MCKCNWYDSLFEGIGGVFIQHATELFSSYYRIFKNRNVLVVTTTLFISYGTFLSWYFILPLYLRDLGASVENIGISYFFLDIGYCLLQFPGGYFSDIFGRKKIITYPTYIFPILYIVAALTQKWELVVITVALSNIISGFNMPALYSIIAESVDENDRGLAFGLFEIAIAAAMAFGPGLGYFFARTPDGMRMMMFATAGAAIVAAIIRHLFLEDTAKHEDFDTSFKSIKKAVNVDVVLTLISFIFLNLLIYITVYGPFIPLYSKDVIKIDRDSIQLMFMAGGFFAIFFNLISGKITQQIGPRNALILGTLGHAILFIPWLFTRNVFQASLVYVPSFLLLQLAYIGYDTLKTNLTEIKTRSSVLGIIGMASGLIGALSPYIGTKFFELYGYSAPFYISLVFAAFSVIYLLPIKSNRV